MYVYTIQVVKKNYVKLADFTLGGNIVIAFLEIGSKMFILEILTHEN